MKNLRENKGITLIVLIITIVVLLIIAGISISGGITGIEESNDNRAMTELEKVQHAITQRYSKFELTKDTSLIVGTKIDDLPTIPTPTGETKAPTWKVFQVTSGATVSTHPERKYYRLSQSDLQNLGLTGSENGSSYIVNYYSGEIFDENKKQTSKGTVLYKTAMENEASELGDDVIRKGLLGWYDADNNTGSGHSSSTKTWFDLSGNGRNGTITNITIKNNYATFGRSRVDLGYMNDFTNKITLEATIDISQILNTDCSIICNYQNGGVGLKLSYGKPSFMIYLKGVGYVECISNDTLSLNNKYHIVGVYDGLNLNLYINGIKPDNNIIRKWPSNNSVVLDSPKTIQPPYSDKYSMIIGADPEQNGYTGYFNGNIYDVRIYNEALSEDEIHHNYILDKARYGIEE